MYLFLVALKNYIQNLYCNFNNSFKDYPYEDWVRKYTMEIYASYFHNIFSDPFLVRIIYKRIVNISIWILKIIFHKKQFVHKKFIAFITESNFCKPVLCCLCMLFYSLNVPMSITWLRDWQLRMLLMTNHCRQYFKSFWLFLNSSQLSTQEGEPMLDLSNDMFYHEIINILSITLNDYKNWENMEKCSFSFSYSCHIPH